MSSPQQRKKSRRLEVKKNPNYKKANALGFCPDPSNNANPETTKYHGNAIKGKNEKPFYGVAIGRKVGVFNNAWIEAESLTKCFQHARFKGFDTASDAWVFVLNENKTIPPPNSMDDVHTLSESEILEYRSECDSAKAEKINNNFHDPHGIFNSGSSETIEWTVQKILDRRTNSKGQYEYLVNWEGYADPTWEPESNCTNSTEAIRDFMDRYLNGDSGPATQDLTKNLLQIDPIDDEILSNHDPVNYIEETMTDQIEELNLSTPITLSDNSILDTNLSKSSNSINNNTRCCDNGPKPSKSNKVIMLTNNKIWNVNLNKLCHFSNSSIISISSFKINIMDISRECGAFNRFNMIWANLIQNLTNKRSVIQHLCGSLVQVFPSLMLQKCSNNDKDNIDALNRRLSSW